MRPRTHRFKLYFTDPEWETLCRIAREDNIQIETVIRLAIRTQEKWRAGLLVEANKL